LNQNVAHAFARCPSRAVQGTSARREPSPICKEFRLARSNPGHPGAL
jgi:hypothetical protein